MHDGLQERHVIVTGGARGIGAGISTVLAAAGARVTVMYRERRAAADDVVARIAAAGGEAQAIAADVADSRAVHDAIEAAVAGFGPIHGLVNNAGMTSGGPAFENIDDRAWCQVVDVNAVGTHRCIAAALPHMRRGGAVITTSSPAGLYGSLVGVHYSVGKAAVIAITHALAPELSKRGIRINCIVPGSFPTELRAAAKPDAVSGSFRPQQALQRSGTPEEMGEVVRHLLSPAGAIINDQVVVVDGGRILF